MSHFSSEHWPKLSSGDVSWISSHQSVVNIRIIIDIFGEQIVYIWKLCLEITNCNVKNNFFFLEISESVWSHRQCEGDNLQTTKHNCDGELSFCSPSGIETVLGFPGNIYNNLILKESFSYLHFSFKPGPKNHCFWTSL